jgi:hypothetical protein
MKGSAPSGSGQFVSALCVQPSTGFTFVETTLHTLPFAEKLAGGSVHSDVMTRKALEALEVARFARSRLTDCQCGQKEECQEVAGCEG